MAAARKTHTHTHTHTHSRCTGQVCARSRFAGNFLVQVPARPSSYRGTDRNPQTRSKERETWGAREALVRSTSRMRPACRSLVTDENRAESCTYSFPRDLGIRGSRRFFFFPVCWWLRGGVRSDLPSFFLNESLTFSPPGESTGCARQAPTQDPPRCLQGVGGLLKIKAPIPPLLPWMCTRLAGL